MNDRPTITICETPLTVKEFDGQRVVTFRDIDTLHRRPDGTARRNFNTNKTHFLEGTDFFKITPNEFRTAFGEMDARQQNDITLLTETGYLMLVKSFTDDLAWAVQRQLVNLYFRVTRQPAETLPEVAISTRDYLKAASILSECPEKRLPYILEIFRKAGISLEGIPVEPDAPIDRRHFRYAKNQKDVEDQLAACDVVRRAVQELKFSYAQLSRLTHVDSSRLQRYAKGLKRPTPERARFLLKTLEPLIQPDDEQLAIDEL